MANPPPKKLEDQIAELEAVVSELRSCAKCGKSLEPDQSKCPSCGTIVGEKIELPEKPAPRVEQPKPAAPPKPEPEAPAEPPRLPRPEAPAALAAAPPALAPEPVPAEKEPAPGPRPEPEAAEAVEEAAEEPESPPEPVAEEAPPEPEADFEPAAPVRRPRAPPRSEPPSSAGRYAVLGGGALLYVIGLIGFLPYLGKYAGASIMILAALVVVAGIAWRGPAGAPRAPRRAPEPGSGKAPSETDFVCPLCGSDVEENAVKCRTCGAEFEP